MTPEKLWTPRNEMLAQEAFIRRAAAVGGPFMLKGSFVTRQYLAHPEQRIPQDLDWVCLTPAQSEEQMRTLLNAWATAVTEQPATDGFTFQSFRENTFWRMIEYAMSDDFPTVNTDVGVWLPGHPPTTEATMLSISVDVSFNLVVEPPPVPLTYRPLEGETFLVPRTCPLALQVAWKLHQTLVRPRYKDLTDLIALLAVPAFDASTRAAALQAFVDECHSDQVDPRKLRYYATGDAAADSRKFGQRESSWFHQLLNSGDKASNPFGDIYLQYGHHLGAGSKSYTSLPELFADFQLALNRAGINAAVLEYLPLPTPRPAE
ncbi:nucleotidyl transferase AbiEii/AbiGii toxin family protein [Hymenobacter negativus]|uniref:Nucleotidyl transferase AbiEii/AbiGii toxin family protein n=1 Tax=Hymenobacter negativus TaxID=2795026 RepID=A0ABS3QHT2_9BACT|nr:nucleotidyl transferase AbiEii/AbiGii toxin family protein [Hymenobacter negativus]MBO2010796.1 nucleotidyl transferase AbiEii/AbiGii toxin family protein [Hymenobacter negativus]